MSEIKKEVDAKRINLLITVVSIAVPVVVAILFGVRLPNVEPLYNLPPIYAAINGITAFLLIIAVLAIKKGNSKLHEKLMKLCILLSLIFLVLYIAYHMTADPTPYGGEGLVRYVYYAVLISHIILSILIIPLVLKTYSFAYLGNFEQHRRWAKITFPIWVYVAISGVLVYLMISPYYAY